MKTLHVQILGGMIECSWTPTRLVDYGTDDLPFLAIGEPEGLFDQSEYSCCPIFSLCR